MSYTVVSLLHVVGSMCVHHIYGYEQQCLGFGALHWSGTLQKKAREKSERPNGVALHCLTPQLSGELAQLQHFLNEQSSKKQVILYLLQLLQCSLKQISYSNREGAFAAENPLCSTCRQERKVKWRICLDARLICHRPRRLGLLALAELLLHCSAKEAILMGMYGKGQMMPRYRGSGKGLGCSQRKISLFGCCSVQDLRM